jgi:hypothetical protein
MFRRGPPPADLEKRTMSDASDVSGAARQLVNDYRKALEFLDARPDPLSLDDLQEAWHMSGAGMSEEAIAERYEAEVAAHGAEEGGQKLRDTLRTTLTQGIETFQQVISEIGE